MSDRALKALALAVVGLGLVWLIVSVLPGGRGADPSETMSAFFDDVTPESVTRIGIQGPEDGEGAEIFRENGEWKVNGFRADPTTLARIWEAVDNAEVRDLVASNPANHGRMGVSPDSAWKMELNLAGGTRSILVGGPGRQFGTAFARLPDEDQVYLLAGNLRSQVTRSLDEWRNKRVAAVDTAAVWRIQVELPEGLYSLARGDSLWVLGDGAEADPTAVRGMLGEMARLDATGFFQEGDSIPPLQGTIRAMDEGGEVLARLEVGAGEGDRWVRAAGDTILYRVASWRATRLLPDLEAVTGGG